MVAGLFNAAGQTALDPDEAAGLIPSHITTLAELNEYEQANILAAQRWAMGARQRGKEMLDEVWLRALHKRMFDRTWKWAGTFRASDKNIGVPWEQIGPRLRQLVDNARYQVEAASLNPDELVVRFHHALVCIHPFVNGNGRHARMAADLLIMRLGAARFSWGATADLASPGDARERYLDALRAADIGRFRDLIGFARS